MSLNIQVSKVFYPGLPDAPRSALVQELFTDGGAGGMLSFEVKGGVDVAEAVTRVRRLAVLARQERVSSVQSCCQSRAPRQEWIVLEMPLTASYTWNCNAALDKLLRRVLRGQLQLLLQMKQPSGHAGT